MITALSSPFLSVRIQSLGAEIRNIIDLNTGFEFMWQADPDVWARTSPILFPIVGRLKNNRFHYNGQTYTLPQHGFARDREFELVSQQEQEVHYRLKADELSKAVYPFDFELDIRYRLHERTLTCEWIVMNSGAETLYYAIGAHPGFNLMEARIDDYEVTFEHEIEGKRHLLQEGLFNQLTAPIEIQSNSISLDSSLFEQDAIVLKHPDCERYTLRHKKKKHAISFHDPFSNSLGIWAKNGCQSFLCIEPWQGFADSTDADGILQHKEAISELQPNEKRSTWYAMTFDI